MEIRMCRKKEVKTEGLSTSFEQAVSKEVRANLKDFFKSKYLEPIPAEADALPASSRFFSMDSESETEQHLTPTTITREICNEEQLHKAQIKETEMKEETLTEAHAPLTRSDVAKCEVEEPVPFILIFPFVGFGGKTLADGPKESLSEVMKAWPTYTTPANICFVSINFIYIGLLKTDIYHPQHFISPNYLQNYFSYMPLFFFFLKVIC